MYCNIRLLLNKSKNKRGANRKDCKIRTKIKKNRETKTDVTTHRLDQR